MQFGCALYPIVLFRWTNIIRSVTYTYAFVVLLCEFPLCNSLPSRWTVPVPCLLRDVVPCLLLLQRCIPLPQHLTHEPHGCALWT